MYVCVTMCTPVFVFAPSFQFFILSWVLNFGLA